MSRNFRQVRLIDSEDGHVPGLLRVQLLFTDWPQLKGRDRALVNAIADLLDAFERENPRAETVAET